MAKPRMNSKQCPGRRPRQLTPDRHSLAKQGAAVLALGLGLAAAGAPAEAAILYFPVNQRLQDPPGGPPQKFYFLNYGGNQFYAYHVYNTWMPERVAGVNGILRTVYSNVAAPPSFYIYFLAKGTPIHSQYFIYSGILGKKDFRGNLTGNFRGEGPGYVGLQFMDAGGQPHYGWALVEVPADVGSMYLYGYAYETIADKGIGAGAVPLPNSLLLLASGATGLLAFRRKRRAE